MSWNSVWLLSFRLLRQCRATGGNCGTHSLALGGMCSGSVHGLCNRHYAVHRSTPPAMHIIRRMACVKVRWMVPEKRLFMADAGIQAARASVTVAGA
ncbi:hypothetical protein C8Q74DRAFT_366518 [Fomes fomentarius]|nr:hypothetical protein C8Q74DRAFT_366518 [Fomes fomentarius]